jgi:hypothetical protein
MAFRIRLSALAQRQIDDFARYLSAYSDDFALEQLDRLDRIFSVNLRDSPLREQAARAGAVLLRGPRSSVQVEIAVV